MAKLRRICIVCFEDPRIVAGGVQRRIAEEIRYFHGKGIDLTVLTAGTPGGEADGARIVSIPVDGIIFPIRYFSFVRQAGAWLRRHPDFDLVEGHHVAGAAVSEACPDPARRPFFFSEVIHGNVLDEWLIHLRFHGWLSRGTPAAAGLWALSPMEGRAARTADCVVTLSRYEAERARELYRAPAERIVILPNGINPRIFHPAAARRAADGRILFAGRWDERKGILSLISAFARARAQLPGLRLQLAGGGVLAGRIRSECRRLAITPAVEFPGWLREHELADAYRAADIIVMPSLQEGQGIVALEAQACGRPLIATNAGGLAENLVDGKTGILVPVGDPAALEAAILRLAGDDRLRRDMGRMAARWASQFDWDSALARQTASYRKAVRSRR